MQKLSTLTNKFPDNGAGLLLFNMLGGVYSKMSSFLFNSGALAIGTTTTKINLAAAITYMINGTLLQKAITNDIVDPTVVTTAAGYFNCFYIYGLRDGTFATINGTEGATLAAMKLPQIPENACVIGLVIVTKSDGAFTDGTAFGAANVTTTYINTNGVMHDSTALAL